MSTVSTINSYEDGLKALLELCESLFGHMGNPIFIEKDLNDNKNISHFEMTKNSLKILNQINNSTDNPLVKLTTNYALDQNCYYKDHTLYLIIISLNLFFRLRLESINLNILNSDFIEIEKIIEKALLIQGNLHKSFDTNFENLVELVVSLCSTKLYGYSSLKIENFSKFLVASFLQSIPDFSEDAKFNYETWIKPTINIINEQSLDEFKTGEIIEGIIYPIEKNKKTYLMLNQIVNLRSFIKYENLYTEKRFLNALILEQDNAKLNENIHTISIHDSENLIEKIENAFLNQLENLNIGIIFCLNTLTTNFRLKLFESRIFYLENVDKVLIERTKFIFGVDKVDSLLFKDLSSYVFLTEIPTIKDYYNSSYLLLNKSYVITLILYRALDDLHKIDYYLSDCIFDILSKLFLKFSQNEKLTKYLTTICHGHGCTEYLLAGIILRLNQSTGITPNFWLNKPTTSNGLRNAVSLTFIHLWKLLNSLQLKEAYRHENILNNCINNLNCICPKRNRSTIYDHIDDIVDIKLGAIRSALKLAKVLINTDTIIKS